MKLLRVTIDLTAHVTCRPCYLASLLAVDRLPYASPSPIDSTDTVYYLNNPTDSSIYISLNVYNPCVLLNHRVVAAM